MKPNPSPVLSGSTRRWAQELERAPGPFATPGAVPRRRQRGLRRPLGARWRLVARKKWAIARAISPYKAGLHARTWGGGEGENAGGRVRGRGGRGAGEGAREGWKKGEETLKTRRLATCGRVLGVKWMKTVFADVKLWVLGSSALPANGPLERDERCNVSINCKDRPGLFFFFFTQYLHTKDHRVARESKHLKGPF